MVSTIISLPGRMAYEWTEKHPSRTEIEVSQLAVLFFSGCVGFNFPGASTLAISTTILFLGGAIYRISQEQDFDHNFETKKLAFETMRLSLAVFLGFCLGAAVRDVNNLGKVFFGPPITAQTPAELVTLPFRATYEFFKAFPKMMSVFMYPILTGITWFSEPMPYQGKPTTIQD